MSIIFIIIGIIFQVLDNAFDKGRILVCQEFLNYFIGYYQPFPRRRHFWGLLLLIVGLAAIFDYIIYNNLNYYLYLLIFTVMLIGPYLLIFLVAIIDYFFLNKAHFKLNYLMLEREMMQQFSLALIHPIIILAFLLRAFLTILIYPWNGILIFKSFAGLLGFIFMITGGALYFL